MLKAFSTAATGMTAQQMIVDVIANNLANVNTTGFKRSQIDFQDLIYVKLAEAGREIASGTETPVGFEIGSGVLPASTSKIYTQGTLINTGNDLDVAIEGKGFFKVTLSNGDERYTRDGSLKVDSAGNIVTSSGYIFAGTATISGTPLSINIGVDGTVQYYTGADSDPQSAGTIELYRFTNAAGLSSEGENLLAETQASGTAVSGKAGEAGFGRIRQKFLEKSNVEIVKELVDLITAQRAYEINSRAIKAGDEMLKTATRIVS